jgi:hypothetical protein
MPCVAEARLILIAAGLRFANIDLSVGAVLF